MPTHVAMTQHPLKTWRKDKGFTQDEAATQLGVSRWTINQIELRKYAPHWKLCKRLSEATGVALHEFNSDIFPAPEMVPVNQSTPSVAAVGEGDGAHG
ncbi:MAG: helix-turn-helix transcriptional regulator [Pseudomonadota bacterium]